MSPISIVIICKNEADVLAATLQSVHGVTDDVIVYDNGSTDNTPEVARGFNVRVFQGSWEGFGKTKTKANNLAKYDWILSLDADEQADEKLKDFLLGFEPGNQQVVYSFRFKNFLGSKLLLHGEWGNDYHTRLFNRTIVQWNDEPVHETLQVPGNIKVIRMPGAILHQTAKDLQEYAQKTVHYAQLSAEKYFRQGRKSSWFKNRLSPGFNFVNYYILKLGFLDGFEGYVCAKMTAHYTFLKYAMLRELWHIRKATKNKQ
jgi:glycosyltransferase involved in cell wall biosynthesis